jgi:hypothetical protein
MRVLIALAACLFAVGVYAAEPTADGRWKQIDDKTGQPRSIMRIEEKEGSYEAFVEKIFLRPNEKDPDPVCDKCTDWRKGARIIGLKIMNGLRREGLAYSGGEILDPDNGKVYRAKMTLSPDGRTLEVRGFIGVSLFGRSQTWYRE